MLNINSFLTLLLWYLEYVQIQTSFKSILIFKYMGPCIFIVEKTKHFSFLKICSCLELEFP